MAGLALYRAATAAAAPLMRWYLNRRIRAGQEDPARVSERFGRATVARPSGPLVWLHAASVGESLSALPLVEGLLERNAALTILVTTGTVTSARIIQQRLPQGAIHQFVPADHPAWVRRFLDHWRPDLALWIESELWLNLLDLTQNRGIPTGLLNGRLSRRSYRRWRACGGILKPILRRFTVCLAQNVDQVERFTGLGATNARTVGNLKYAAKPLAADSIELAKLRAAIGDRPLWLAASTHAGEEAMAAEAHLALRHRWPSLLTLIAPRHPKRADEIAGVVTGHGLTVCRRSAGSLPAGNTDVYLADTLGELGLLYRLADISFVGGSFSGHGGHNPIEPARLGSAILYGPDMGNFSEVVTALEAERAGLRLAEPGELGPAVARLLDDRQDCQRRIAAAGRIAEAESDVLARMMAELEPLLAPLA